MSDSRSPIAGAGRVPWVPALLFGFAAVLLLDPLPFQSPVSPPRSVPGWATDPTPVRQPTWRPEYTVGVFTYQCSDCHRILPAPDVADHQPTQHTEIQLDHGLNTRCCNCHHPRQRDALVDDVGNEIAWDTPQPLCARCHGPVYWDWRHGSHGRTNGYWDTAVGVQSRRRCIECHDPHRPAFPALRPAPAPRTLRMGRPDLTDGAAPVNPLRLRAGQHRVPTNGTSNGET